ncbi:MULTISPECIES: phosphotransferase [unclassified Corynebacterium]|uniref:phosphotransferase n=1 Tax=unclassified Corynebacterium TaxID=2624378 RepID=UPI002168DB6A|nr:MULTISPECIES: phosphotransferase [unclassified Corynebacterium]MCS4491060.1 phosphotransferase [Corynebacterium sp. ES2715-CONJ3]MCS4531059.1 phosphotransferase [Corynebacterium sp. ES2730-CONJ]
MNSPQHSEIIAVAESVLSQRYGGEQRLAEVEELAGSGSAVVLRARVQPSPFLQQKSLVVKYLPGADHPATQSRLMREIASYQFTTSMPESVRPGPVLLAHDITQKILIISDAGDGDTVADLLNVASQTSRDTLLRGLGRALGQMHAATASREPDFRILLSRMLNQNDEIVALNNYREELISASIPFGIRLVETAGIEVPPEVKRVAATAARRLISGNHRAFTPFDLSPDNILVVKNRLHFLDYEWAGFRDVTFDVASVIAGFPHFISAQAMSDEEADLFIDAWVHEVANLWPNTASRARLNMRILTALVGWSFFSIALTHIDLDDPQQAKLLSSINEDASNTERLVQALYEAVDPWAHELFDENAQKLEEDVLLIRKDLQQTFEALRRFASRDLDEGILDVAQFAASMNSRLSV